MCALVIYFASQVAPSSKESTNVGTWRDVVHGAAKSRIQLKQLSTHLPKLILSLATVSKCVGKYVLFHTAFLRLMVQEWLTWMALAQNLSQSCSQAVGQGEVI